MSVVTWRRIQRAAILGLLLLAFFCWGGRSLWESSEARYGEVAREMVRDGHWLMPHLHGAPHMTKPPLAYWTTAGSMALLGVNPWGARLPLCFAYLCTVLCVWGMAQAIGHSALESLCAALVYATSGFTYSSSFVLTTDPFLSMWMAVGMLGLLRCWRAPGLGNAILVWVGFGLAFLTKGPPSLLPFLAVVAFVLIRRDLGAASRLRPLWGVPLMATIGMSWFAAVIARDPSLIDYYLRHEVAGRVLTNEFKRDSSPLNYVAILAFGAIPWAVLWPSAMRRALAARKERGGRLADWQLFCLLWVALPLIVFFLSKSRMPLYLLPTFQPLALILAKPLARHFEGIRTWSRARRHATALGGIAWICVLLTTRVIPDSVVGSPRAGGVEAEAIRSAFEGSNDDVVAVWIRAKALPSIEFNLDRTIFDESDRRYHELWMLRDTYGTGGRRALFLTESDRLDRLFASDVPVRVLAIGEKLCVFEVVAGSE